MLLDISKPILCCFGVVVGRSEQLPFRLVEALQKVSATWVLCVVCDEQRSLLERLC